MATKRIPYINRFTGSVLAVTKKQAKQLNEDWEQPKVVTNDKGKKVFRFKLSSPVTGRDGKVHMGTAIVDISENDEQPHSGEVTPNGNRDTE